MSRPPTGNGGSRPPTSRFQEGSMNDRVSAAPPPQFLDPQQIREYERQFFTAPMVKAATTTTHRDSRKKQRERPLSESQSLKSQSPKSPLSNNSSQEERFIAHKKSNGFFGRIRDALFSNKGAGAQAQAQAQPPSHRQQEGIRKHCSMQDSLLSPRTGQMHPLAKHYADMQALQPTGGNAATGNGPALDRPTREEVMQSYNQLMASGFFQSHAIQSTRHARPPTVQPPMPMPSIASAPGSPEPPPRISSINAVTMKIKSPPPSSPVSSKSRHSLHISPQLANAHMSSNSTSDATAELRRSLGGHAPPVREPRYALRGRKRNRADVDEASQASTGTSSGLPLSPTSAAATLAQPFKRVAKKLRKMPSSPASSDSKLGTTPTPRPATSVATSDPWGADGVVRFVTSISTGGTVNHNERAFRLRSPSPTPPERVIDADAKPSGNIKNARVAKSTAAPRRMASSGNKLRKRAKSPARRPRSSGTPYLDHDNQFETWEAMGQQHIPANSKANVPCPNVHGNDASEDSPAPMPLSVVPDVNRGIPSVPRIPDQFSRTPNKLSKAGGRGRARHSWLRARHSPDENYNDFDSHMMDIDVPEAAKWQVGEAL